MVESLSKRVRKGNGFIKDVMGYTLINITFPYAIPSYRSAFGAINDREVTSSERIKIRTGFILGCLINITQIKGYFHLARNGHPEILLLPTTTNIISYFFEKYKKSK